MQIVIDKDKEINKLKDMLSNLTDEKDIQSVNFAIILLQNIGAPLPKGHGRLVDANLIAKRYGLDAIALEMAIKALEQEPCEDWYDVPSDEMTLGQARQAVRDLRKKWAEHLPSVSTKKTRWIPCSERMPEDGDTYIVSGYELWEGKKLPFVDCATYPGSYIDGWDTYNDWCEGQEVHIIAWQEMPEALEDEE